MGDYIYTFWLPIKLNSIINSENTQHALIENKASRNNDKANGTFTAQSSKIERKWIIEISLVV